MVCVQQLVYERRDAVVDDDDLDILTFSASYDDDDLDID